MPSKAANASLAGLMHKISKHSHAPDVPCSRFFCVPSIESNAGRGLRCVVEVSVGRKDDTGEPTCVEIISNSHLNYVNV